VLKTIADILVLADLERRILTLEEKHEQRLQQAARPAFAAATLRLCATWRRESRLEEVYSPAEIIVIMLTHFGEGEIKGWGVQGIYIARKPGESEEDLANRAAAEARAHYSQHPSVSLGHVVLQMDRGYEAMP
jgi:hypothetical protein